MKIIGLIEIVSTEINININIKNLLTYCDAICIASNINIDRLIDMIILPLKHIEIKESYMLDLVIFANELVDKYNFSDIYGFIDNNLILINKENIEPFLFKITNNNLINELENNCQNAILEKDYYKALNFYNLLIQKDPNNNKLINEYCIIHYHVFNKNKIDGLKFAINNNSKLFKMFIQSIYEISNVIKTKSLNLSSFRLGNEQYTPSSSCILKYKDNYLINVRHVNYKLINGVFTVPNNNIITYNGLLYADKDLNIKSDIIIMNNIYNDNPRSYVIGFEDLRLFEFNDKVYFIATQNEYSLNGNNEMIVGEYNIEHKTYYNFNIIKSPNNSYCEKNWLPVVNNNELVYIYNWYPLQLGKVNENNQLVIYKTYNVPSFFNLLRGSAVPVYDNDNKIYYTLTHSVIFPNDNISNRQYFNTIVVLDNNLKPIKYSIPFFFKKFNIEYCLGLAVNKDIISFIFSQNEKNPTLISTLISSITFINI
jgi:hypothetical protein